MSDDGLQAAPRPVGPARPPGEPSAELSLLVDVGSAWTKAIVVARARGRWRIAAATAQPSGWGDEELVASLAHRLGGSADRRVLDRVGDLVRTAPRITCHTPSRPGRIGLVAVSSELSGAAARRAAESGGWAVVESATADDGRSVLDRIDALQAADVDAWLLAGGFDDAVADQAVELAGLVAAARGTSGAPVVWAGSAALSETIAALFEPGVVTAVANPRPDPDTSDPVPLRRVLEDLLQRIVEPGSQRHLAPVAFRRAVAELSRASRRRVVGVDLGARYLTWVQADGGEAESRVFASGGLGSPSLVAAGSASRILRGLPLAIDELAVADALQNVRARPSTMPQTEDELAIVHAAARQLLAQAGSDERTLEGVDLLIGSGRTIGGAPRPAQAAQMLLDGVRPLGVTALAIDSSGALPPLGALVAEEIGEGLGVLRDDVLTPLGTAVVCRGTRPGHAAMRVTVRRAGWPSAGPFEVRSGQLRVISLPPGQVAELEIELEGGVSIGAPRRARRTTATVSGGVVGIVLDARDIPLGFPRRTDDRRAVLAAWRDAFVREPVAAVAEAS